jgi:glycine/sarcosine/betaine reductase complex component C subunit alpha
VITLAEKEVKKLIGKAFNDIAQAIESGNFGKRVRIGLTTLGSEHGTEELVKGALIASKQSQDFEIVLIGPKVDTNLEVVEVNSEDEMHKKMEEMLKSGEIDGCVTMHYNFPIGVSTVGKVITPGVGREMFIATTTGTSSAHRVEAMLKNAIYGVITAKTMGIENPTVGVLNVDGARQCERALNDLIKGGYNIRFTESMRSDGGAVMRGNDLLAGTPDVMVTDTLTGNILMKVFSSYTTGGSYEALGYGYGPGIGEAFNKTILILSRASGAPVVAGALKYAAGLAKGKLWEVAAAEFEAVKKAGFDSICKSLTKDTKKAASQEEEEVAAPPKKIVTGSISGIDIMELENAVRALWKAGIYAESGMGCTGPIVLVAEDELDKATAALAKGGFVAAEQGSHC